MTNSILEENLLHIKRGKEQSNNDLARQYNRYHCMGVVWTAIFRIECVASGVKIHYSHGVTEGTLTYKISHTDYHSLTEGDNEKFHPIFLSERNKVANEMIQFLNQGL